MTLAMSRAERETFLTERHVAILAIEAGQDGRSPLAVPVWYQYEPGGLVSFITGASSRKGRLLDTAGRATLCAQDEHMPYRYVSVEGPIVDTEHPADPAERRRLAQRYLGRALGDAYIEATRGRAADMKVFRLSPEHWLTENQANGSEAERIGAR